MPDLRRITGTVSEYVSASWHLHMATAADRGSTYVHVCKRFCTSHSSLCQVCGTPTSGKKERAALSDTEDVEELDILFWFSLSYSFCKIE